jgi:hypothetical protein
MTPPAAGSSPHTTHNGGCHDQSLGFRRAAVGRLNGDSRKQDPLLHIFADAVQGQREYQLQHHLRWGAVRALNQVISNVLPSITLVHTISACAQAGRLEHHLHRDFNFKQLRFHGQRMELALADFVVM